MLAPEVVARFRDEGHEVTRVVLSGVQVHALDVAIESIGEPTTEVAAVMQRLRPEALVLFPWRSPLRTRARSLEAGVLRTVEAAAAAGARRVAYWGSAAAYSLDASLPARPLREADPLATQGVGGRLARVDASLRQWAGQSAGADLYIFRACTVVGREAGWPLGDLAALAVLPRFAVNPPLQLIADEDAAALLVHVLGSPHPGTYNVAADGLIMVSELARAIGRPSVRLPAAVWTAAFAVRRLLRRPAPDPRTVGLLQYSRVVDNSRLKTHLGFRPRLSGRQALARFLRQAAHDA